MGIKGLSTLISKLCKDAGVFDNVPMSYFSGQRIAIDATGWLCEIMSAANSDIVDRRTRGVETDEEWRKAAASEPDPQLVTQVFAEICVHRLIELLTLHITPIFVFDGEPLPDKALTRKKRVETRFKVHDDIKVLKEKLESVELDDESEAPEASDENPDQPTATQTAEEMSNQLASKLKQAWRLGGEHIDLFIAMARKLGFPVVQSDSDAEKTAALLNRDGYCAAAWTSDSDALAFGATMIIHRTQGKMFDAEGRRVTKCVVWYRPQILQKLGLPEHSLLDMCILCGCDYNEAMPEVGPSKAYALVRKYGFIEQFPQTNGWLNPLDPSTCKPIVPRLSARYRYNLGILNHVRCRQIFTPRPAAEAMLAGSLDVKPCVREEFLALLQWRARFQPHLDNLLSLRQKLRFDHHSTTIRKQEEFVKTTSSSVQKKENMGLPGDV